MKITNRIINSILDNDLYKFTQQNMVMMKFPDLLVRYRFIDRNNLIYPKGFSLKLMEQINKMSQLKLTKNEGEYLSESFPFLSPTYLLFLSGYKYNSNEVKTYQDKEGHLFVDIEGLWVTSILWEVPILSLISELYFKETGQVVDLNQIQLKTADVDKVRLFEKHNTYFADMGTRRRYSFDNHYRVVGNFKESSNHVFVGTSNVYLGYSLKIPVIGTIAHESIMVHAAIYGYKMANKLTMENWVDVYHGDLGTMLSDTFTTDEFLISFTKKYAKLYDGVRHDSGDPFEFVDKIINHYKSLNIDPMSKHIIFSDGLNPKLATEIKEYCVGKIKSSFGLGTNLSCDVGVIPMRIVIKISSVFINDEWVDVVKLSDDIGKNTGTEVSVKICKQILRISD